ncbi:DUF3797 domain-containing protein [Bacillus sp. Fil]|uniref:DUF3797 domain-containing protein n=1 Tax=Bacillus sp. Fil TaxID=3459567 RepID=UPI00403AFC02
MDAWKTLELMNEYGKCKQCGNEMIGEGVLEIDADVFKRTCKCGWSVEVNEGSSEREVGSS